MQTELVIEIASDVICPWCYIGRRRLEKALALLDGEVKPVMPSIAWSARRTRVQRTN
jgi:predicted DsbA family dithiol-disulfide isomerase